MKKSRGMALMLGGVLVIALAGACAKKAATTTTAATTTSAAASSATSTTAASSSGSSTTAASSTGSSAIEKLAGTYTGTWKNTTFGSSGAAKATITVDSAAKTVSVNYDLDGSVFGASDPPAETLKGTIDSGGNASAHTTSALFGPIDATYTSAGVFTMTAAAVPSARIASFKVTGPAKGDSFTWAYDVVFKDGSKAAGTITLARA